MNILIFGASGWVGSDLIDALWKQQSSANITGTYHTTMPPEQGVNWECIDYRETDQITALLDSTKPTHIINAMMGDKGKVDEAYIKANKEITTWAAGNNAHYTFLSTSMVFDANLSHPHKETDTPNASDFYGKTKQRCEEDIAALNPEACIVRFASPHGAHKHNTAATRTTKFLSTLKSGERVTVPAGIIQNRLHMPELCDQIATVIFADTTGVIHFGPRQGSEELQFLRNLAAAFGYDAGQVEQHGEQHKDLQTIPRKVLEIIPRTSSISEEDTIQALAADPRLAHFHN